MKTLSIDERSALREAMHRLMRDANSEEDVRKVMESEPGFDPGLWRQLAEMGITGLIIDENYGGSGVGPMELEAIMEEAGAALLCGPLLASSVIAAELLRALGDDDLNTTLLPAIASGETIATAVLTGDAGSWDLEDVAITATEESGQWLLDGRGNYVLHGQNADVFIVIAKADAGLQAFEVAANAGGIEVSTLPTFDRTLRLAAIGFNRVTANKVSATNDIPIAVQSAVNMGLVALAGEQAGGTQKVLDQTVEYAKTRIQFGRQIGSFQAIKHMAADLLVETESAISAARHAAAVLAEEGSNKDEANKDEANKDEAVSLAAFACADAYVKAAADSVQMHGGIAFTWEHSAHLYLRRARAGAQLLGNSTKHRERYLQALGG